MVQIKITLSDGALSKVDTYTEASGASRSEVMESLVNFYIDELRQDVIKLMEGVNFEEEAEEEVDVEVDDPFGAHVEEEPDGEG